MKPTSELNSLPAGDLYKNGSLDEICEYCKMNFSFKTILYYYYHYYYYIFYT